MGCGCSGQTRATPAARVVASANGGVVVTPQFFVEVNGKRLNRSWSSLIAATEAAQRYGGVVRPV